MNNEQKVAYIKEHIGAYSDFPKEGIVFRDIFSSLTDGKVCIYIKELLVDYVRQHYPDVELVVGLESRGFLFNLLIASELGIGCAPIRKKGKLPGECISVEYQLEYGSDVFEVQKTAIKPGQKVILVDDLLATGGSLDAAIQLVRKAGGVVISCVVIMELADLNAKKRFDCPIHSFMKF